MSSSRQLGRKAKGWSRAATSASHLSTSCTRKVQSASPVLAKSASSSGPVFTCQCSRAASWRISRDSTPSSQAELTGDLADYLAERLPDERRYADPDLAPAKATGEIDGAALARLRTALPFAAALDEDALRDWFGRFITRYRVAQHPAAPSRTMSEISLRKQLADGARLLRHPWSRLAWSRGKAGTALYANGHAWPAPLALARQLCAQREITLGAIPSAPALALLLALVNEGHLVVRKARRR